MKEAVERYLTNRITANLERIGDGHLEKAIKYMEKRIERREVGGINCERMSSNGSCYKCYIGTEGSSSKGLRDFSDTSIPRAGYRCCNHDCERVDDITYDFTNEVVLNALLGSGLYKEEVEL